MSHSNPDAARHTGGSGEDDLMDTWSIKEAHAVAAVMTLYVNGVPTKIHPHVDGHYSVIVGPKGSDTDVLEVVLAYRMVLVPKGQVDRTHFMIPASAANVSKILDDETSRLWGQAHSKDAKSLCEMGITMVDPDDRLSKPGEKEADGSHPGFSSPETTKSSTSDESRDAPGAKPTPSDGTDRKTSPEPSAGPEGPKYPSTPTVLPPVGLPRNASPRNQIEYLTWRHLEHILSVCAIPLSPPAVYMDKSARTRDNQDELIAITCGDISGHRLCSSASL